MAEDNRIKLRIDLGSGRTFELDAPRDDFHQALQNTRELIGPIDFNSAGPSAPPPVTVTVPAEPSRPTRRARLNKTGAPSSSAARPGRIGSFDPIRDLLTEKQHQELHSFVKEKVPADQSDQVLVTTYMGQQLLGRAGFSYNEIYTMLWRANIEPLPKALDVVVQRLMQEQLMDKGEAGFYVKFLGQQRVERGLPKAED